MAMLLCTYLYNKLCEKKISLIYASKFTLFLMYFKSLHDNKTSFPGVLGAMCNIRWLQREVIYVANVPTRWVSLQQYTVR